MSVEVDSVDLLDGAMLPDGLGGSRTAQTLLWQQGHHHFTDSGIQSALASHTQSISGRMDAEALEAMETSASVLSSGAHSVTGLDLEPEDMEVAALELNGGGVWPGPMPQTPGTAAAMNGPSSVFHPDMAANLMSPDTPGLPPSTPGAGEAEAAAADLANAASAIPDLIRLIEDEDTVIVNQAAMMVFQLSKGEQSRDTLSGCPEMMAGLVRGLERTDDPETARFLSGTLYNMSQQRSGLLAMFCAGAVPPLVRQLGTSVETTLFYAITTLHNLLLHQEGAKHAVRICGGLQEMVILLDKDNVKFLAICTDCLQLLAYSHQESKLMILANGGPQRLIRILNTYSYEKLLWTTTRVLKVLSVCPSNKPAILEAHGVEALTAHVRSLSQRLVHNALWTLRNLSDAATRMENIQPLLQTLLQLLSCPDPNIVTCTAGILSNLTCNNGRNKLTVCQMGGIDIILKAINGAEKEEIIEPCVCALRHLTSRHEQAETAQISVRLHNGLSLMARLLKTPGASWALLKAVVGLARNIALCQGNQAALREQGVLEGLVSVLHNAFNEVKGQLGTHGQLACPARGVKVEEVAEGAGGALHVLARDAANRACLLKQLPALALLSALAHCPVESLQRVAVSVLCELVMEPAGAEAIAVAGLAPRLRELAQGRNEATVAFAATVLYYLAERDKKAQQQSCTGLAQCNYQMMGSGVAPPAPQQLPTAAPVAGSYALPQTLQQHAGTYPPLTDFQPQPPPLQPAYWEYSVKTEPSNMNFMESSGGLAAPLGRYPPLTSVTGAYQHQTAESSGYVTPQQVPLPPPLPPHGLSQAHQSQVPPPGTW